MRIWDMFDPIKFGPRSFQGQILFMKLKCVFDRSFWKGEIFHVRIWFDLWIKVTFRGHQKVELFFQINLNQIKNDLYWKIYELQIFIEHGLAPWYFSEGDRKTKTTDTYIHALPTNDVFQSSGKKDMYLLL